MFDFTLLALRFLLVGVYVLDLAKVMGRELVIIPCSF